MVLEEKNSYDIHLSQLTKQSTGGKKGLSFGHLRSGDLVMNTALGARLARKWGKVRVTEGGSPHPSSLPSLAPLLPLQSPLYTYSAICSSPPHPHPITISCGTYV